MVVGLSGYVPESVCSTLYLWEGNQLRNGITPLTKLTTEIALSVCTGTAFFWLQLGEIVKPFMSIFNRIDLRESKV